MERSNRSDENNCHDKYDALSHHEFMMRKSIVFIMTIVFLTPITPLHARWIGDMARDYSWRLEQDRVSRESVSSARERRIQERKEKELRAGGRTRLVPLQKDYNETEALLGPAALGSKKNPK